MALRTLDPDVARRLIEGEQDILTPAARRRWDLFERLRCPACGGGVGEERQARDMERSPVVDGVTPHGRARCVACRCLFDPFTKLIYEQGSPAHAVEPAIKILGR